GRQPRRVVAGHRPPARAGPNRRADARPEPPAGARARQGVGPARGEGAAAVGRPLLGRPGAPFRLWRPGGLGLAVGLALLATAIVASLHLVGSADAREASLTELGDLARQGHVRAIEVTADAFVVERTDDPAPVRVNRGPRTDLFGALNRMDVPRSRI